MQMEDYGVLTAKSLKEAQQPMHVAMCPAALARGTEPYARPEVLAMCPEAQGDPQMQLCGLPCPKQSSRWVTFEHG